VITPGRRYDDLVARFAWAMPQEFNFGALVDAWATDRSRIALYWEDERGRTARHTFWDVAKASNRVMNALAGLGVRRGDPVLVMLPRVPEWQAAIVGALKLGALVVPCTASLRAKDVAYRVAHSGARAIVTTVEQAGVVDAAVPDRSALGVRIALGGAPAPAIFERGFVAMVSVGDEDARAFEFVLNCRDRGFVFDQAQLVADAQVVGDFQQRLVRRKLGRDRGEGRMLAGVEAEHRAHVGVQRGQQL